MLRLCSGENLLAACRRDSPGDFKIHMYTGLCTQTGPRESKPPRRADKLVSTEKNTTAAQRNPPGTLRTQEPSNSLGKVSSCFRLHLDLTLCHRSTYTDTTRRELASQESQHTCQYM